MMEHLRCLCTVLCLLTLGSLAASQECVQDSNCRLPDCFCPTFSHPLGAKNIPQIVYFGFDDAVTTPAAGKYDQLFTKERKNPNGCPIVKTLYVSNANTEYNLVSKYYKAGDEIAVHSVTHTNIDTAEKLRKEATEQRSIIERKGDVSAKDIIGWRSPNLKTAGDDQPRVLKELGYTYDISLTYASDPNFPFPFTLDYGYPYKCSIQPCPNADSKHEGFWEVMVHSYTDASGLPCTYVDSCRPDSEEAALEFLWTNFMKTYEREKSPFGLNMHAAWFFFPDYLPAMGRFIDRLLALDDVYIVNVAQMIEWMKKPTPLSEIEFFEPWGCNGNTRKRATVAQPTQPPVVTTKDQYVHKTLNISSAVHTYSAAPNTHSEAPKTVSRDHSGSTLPKSYSRYEANTRINFRPTPQPTTSTTAPVRVPVFWQRLMNKDYFNGADRPEDPPVSCVQGVNCKLPACFCKTTSPPNGLLPRRIPQIVYISVDSHIDGRTFGPLMQIFSSPRVNPNGCPVTGSVFVPLTGNYPPYASTLSFMGAKLGIGLGQGAGVESASDEVNELIKELSPLYGMRSSRVDTKYTEEILNALKRRNTTFYNFIVKESLDSSWPYALDFGLDQERCPPHSSCPQERQPGLWHVPLSPLQIPGHSWTCLIPDSCPFLFKNEIDTYQIFKYNFDRHYFTNRIPFGININERWLVSSGGQARVRGLNAFLDDILKRSDVVLVSVDKLLQWVESSGKYGPAFSC